MNALNSLIIFKLVQVTKTHLRQEKRRWPYRWFSQHEPQLLTGVRRAARCGGQCVGAACTPRRSPAGAQRSLTARPALPHPLQYSTFLEQCRFDTNTEITSDLSSSLKLLALLVNIKPSYHVRVQYINKFSSI